MLRFVHVAESGVVTRRFDQGLQTLVECIGGLASQRELWHIPFGDSLLTQYGPLPLTTPTSQ